MGIGAGANGSQRWSQTVGSLVSGSPVVSANNTVYVPVQSSGLIAFDGSQGTEKWTFYPAGYLDSCPAIGANGYLYIGMTNNSQPATMYGIDAATGKQIWSFAAGGGIDASPAIGPDGTVYFGCGDGKLYALDGTTGAKKWTFTTGGEVEGTPSIDSNGNLYFGSDDGNLYDISSAGEQNWAFSAGQPIETSPCQDSNNNSYFATTYGTVYGVNNQGSQIWAFSDDSDDYSSLCLGANGDLYFGSYDDKVYALKSANGSLDWSYTTGGVIQGPPALGADGTVYVGSQDHSLYALNGTTGAKEWSFPTGNIIVGGVVIGADGAIYFGSEDAKVYAIDSNSVSNLYASPSSVTGGSSTHGVVQLSGEAGPNGEQVSLQSNSPSVVVPGSVMVTATKTGVSFAITTSIVAAPTNVTLTATFYSSVKQATLTLEPEPISNFYASLAYVVGSGETFGVVQLSGPAGAGGDMVSLTCPNPDAGIPASVTVPAGKTGASFGIFSPAVGNQESATITATLGTSSKQVTIEIDPFPLSNFYCAPSTITGGTGTTGVVQVSDAASENSVISLQSSGLDVKVPATVNFPAPKTGVSFAITSSPVSASENVVLTATLAPTSKEAMVTLNPSPISNFYVSPSSVVGGAVTHGVVQLAEKAGPSGDVVTLSSASASVVVPASVKVPAGTTGVSFEITTKAVATSTPVKLTATLGASTQQATVTLIP